MPYDPFTFWMQSSMAWMRLVRQQQQACLQMMCAVAQVMPRDTARDLAAEAEDMRAIVTDRPAPLHKSRAPAKVAGA